MVEREVATIPFWKDLLSFFEYLIEHDNDPIIWDALTYVRNGNQLYISNKGLHPNIRQVPISSLEDFVKQVLVKIESKPKTAFGFPEYEKFLGSLGFFGITLTRRMIEYAKKNRLKFINYSNKGSIFS